MYHGFLKSFRNNGDGRLLNFQDPKQSGDFDSNYIKTDLLALPKKVAGNYNICEQFRNIRSLTIRDILVLP